MTGVEERAVDHAEALTASLNKRGLVDPGDHEMKLESQSSRSLSIEPMPRERTSCSSFAAFGTRRRKQLVDATKQTR